MRREDVGQNRDGEVVRISGGGEPGDDVRPDGLFDVVGDLPRFGKPARLRLVLGDGDQVDEVARRVRRPDVVCRPVGHVGQITDELLGDRPSVFDWIARAQVIVRCGRALGDRGGVRGDGEVVGCPGFGGGYTDVDLRRAQLGAAHFCGHEDVEVERGHGAGVKVGDPAGDSQVEDGERDDA